ncbi:SDR family oxidoreductase [Kitasatospora sp. NBC_00085]|uniref:SDR family NAD(P)-dependent oxidoreductase n=1 Tax=unclassified Kitasatospora TaxID=2633591 RepID=UPI003249B377
MTSANPTSPHENNQNPDGAREFAGRTVLITGGSGGMGLATARLVLAGGASVVITGRDEARLACAAAELTGGGHGSPTGAAPGRVLPVRADAAVPAELERLAGVIGERYGRLDGVFANAGIAVFQPVAEATEAQFDRLMAVNVKGVFFTVRHALPLLAAAGGGSVVLNASWTAHRGLAVAPVYSATKAAVQSLARTFGSDLAGQGIRVNSVSPGYIVTDMFEANVPVADREAVRARVPLGRFGQAEDVAETVAFLLSPRSSYLTGQDFVIDGGLVSAAPAG